MEKIKKRNEISKNDCWDLTKCVKNNDEFQKIITKIKELNQKILEMKGHILDNSDNLELFLKTSEQEERLIEKVYIYTRLKYDEDTSNKESINNKNIIEQLINEISDNESFITSEFMEKDLEDVLKLICNNDCLQEYKLYFQRLYKHKSRILTAKEEAIITKALNAFGTPEDGFTSLDTTDAIFPKIKDENGNYRELNHYNWNLFLENKDQNVRKKAFKAYYSFYAKHKNTFAALLKGNYQELEFLRDIRKYDSALEMALDEKNISPKVYENLLRNVHKFMDINVEFQKIKAKLLNNKEYHIYDTYVPVVSIAKKNFSKEEAIKLVKKALLPLGNDYLQHLDSIINSSSIDYYPNEFKHSGAYHWGCYDSPNYVLLNFNGSYDSVSTMAHELGHAVHSQYSKENNSFTYYSYEIFLAEIASTVNETLLSFYFLEHSKTKNEKIYFLCEFLDKVKATIYRQTMFAEFESVMSKKCQNKENLSEDVFSSFYYDLNKKYFKDSTIIDEEIKYEWMRISHFYSPFYVYKYATGLICAICIVNDIFNKQNFSERYLTFLKSGSSMDSLDILKKIDIDLTTDEPFDKAFGFIDECLKKLKILIKEGEKDE